MRYRRAQVPGGTYFFTVALANRKSLLLIELADRLRHRQTSSPVRDCGDGGCRRGYGLSEALGAYQGGLLARHSEG